MNNIELAKAYLEEACRRVRVARWTLSEYAYHIRQCQEAAELSLKAALKLVNIEPPKIRDVGPVSYSLRIGLLNGLDNR